MTTKVFFLCWKEISKYCEFLGKQAYDSSGSSQFINTILWMKLMPLLFLKVKTVKMTRIIFLILK